MYKLIPNGSKTPSPEVEVELFVGAQLVGKRLRVFRNGVPVGFAKYSEGGYYVLEDVVPQAGEYVYTAKLENLDGTEVGSTRNEWSVTYDPVVHDIVWVNEAYTGQTLASVPVVGSDAAFVYSGEEPMYALALSLNTQGMVPKFTAYEVESGSDLVNFEGYPYEAVNTELMKEVFVEIGGIVYSGCAIAALPDSSAGYSSYGAGSQINFWLQAFYQETRQNSNILSGALGTEITTEQPPYDPDVNPYGVPEIQITTTTFVGGDVSRSMVVGIECDKVWVDVKGESLEATGLTIYPVPNAQSTVFEAFGIGLPLYDSGMPYQAPPGTDWDDVFLLNYSYGSVSSASILNPEEVYVVFEFLQGNDGVEPPPAITVNGNSTEIALPLAFVAAFKWMDNAPVNKRRLRILRSANTTVNLVMSDRLARHDRRDASGLLAGLSVRSGVFTYGYGLASENYGYGVARSAANMLNGWLGYYNGWYYTHESLEEANAANGFSGLTTLTNIDGTPIFSSDGSGSATSINPITFNDRADSFGNDWLQFYGVGKEHGLRYTVYPAPTEVDGEPYSTTFEGELPHYATYIATSTAVYSYELTVSVEARKYDAQGNLIGTWLREDAHCGIPPDVADRPDFASDELLKEREDESWYSYTLLLTPFLAVKAGERIEVDVWPVARPGTDPEEFFMNNDYFETRFEFQVRSSPSNQVAPLGGV